MYDLKGKVALVTGAAGKEGLGRAIALRLAQEGANLAVNDLGGAKSRRGSLDDVVAEIDALGKGALAVNADVTKADQVDRMVEETVNHFGRIDILVNNAGAPAGKDRVPVVELEESAWDLVQDVNVKGTFLCSRAVARILISQGQGGKIINISSQAGKQGVPRYAAYCASKFAVCGFTQALAHELGSHRINVNAICPGLIATERIDDMAAALAPAGVSPAAHRQAMIERAIGGTVMGRMAKTGDIANMAAFLASDQSEFLTGLSLSVTGGASMG